MKSSFCIADFPVFSVCSREEVRDIQKHGRFITAAKNETVHRPVEVCTSVGFILSGMLRMTRIFSSGKELVIRSLSAGDMYGELVSFSAARYPCWIIASDHSSLFEIDVDYLYRYFKKSDFVKAFMQDISSKSAGLNSTIEYLSLKTVKQKIAYYLLSMREEQQRIILDRSLTAFAAKMGSSREAVSRALSDMHNVGIIIKDRNAVKITDKSALEELLFE